MHNREITHIVKTDTLSKTKLIVKNKCSFCCHLRETYVKTENNVSWKQIAKARIETLNIQIL